MEPPPLPSRPGWPTRRDFVYLLHPANDLPFFRLFQADRFPSVFSNANIDNTDPQPKYGIHHDTLLTAGRIIACNEPGFLSTSIDRNSLTDRVDDQPDAILLAEKYYYHLRIPQDPPLYTLCRVFRLWRFPHNSLPTTWIQNDIEGDIKRQGESVMSDLIKERDKVCLVSRWGDGLSTAYIVPRRHNSWLAKNKMGVYLSDPVRPLYLDPRNLFTLRGDLHLFVFDKADFAIVPKYGHLCVHFLKHCVEGGQAFQDVQLGGADILSIELLYARFAWAIMKITDTVILEPDRFRFVEDNTPKEPVGPPSQGTAKKGSDEDDNRGEGGGGNGRGNSGGGGDGEFDDDEDMDEISDAGGDMGREGDYRDTSATYGESPPKKKRLAAEDRDSHEMYEDNETAAHTLPFFVDPSQTASRYHYDTIQWYPGRRAVDRRKREYLDAHPEIRAHSGRLMQDEEMS